MKVVKIIKYHEQIAICDKCDKPLKNAYILDNGDVLGIECMRSVMGYEKSQINRIKKEAPEFYKIKFYIYKDDYYIITDGIASPKLSKGRINAKMGMYIDGDYIIMKPSFYYQYTTFKKNTPQWKIDRRKEWTKKHLLG